MRNKKAAALVILSLVGLAVAIAQMSTSSSASLAHFVPRSPLVYAEATNLKDLLVWWRDGEIRANWMATRNYEEFQNSRLYLKLSDRISEWGEQGSYSFSLDNLIAVAGTRSALALYDIGDLKAVGLTEISLVEAQATQLWAAKGNFTKKKVGNQNYYVESNDGVLSFAYVRPYLVLSTDETLLQQTIGLIRGDSPIEPLDSAEKWVQCQKFNPTRSTFSLFLDQERLNDNTYFNRYWLQQNVDDLKTIRAAWIDFTVDKQALTERRYFVQDETGSPEAESNAEAYLQPLRSAHYDFLALQSNPDPEQTAERILKLVNRFSDRYRESSYPPKYSAALERAAQAESKSVYAQKIDEPVLVPASEKLLKADQDETVRGLLQAAQPVGEVRLSYPLWDDQALFVQFPESLAVQLANFDALDQKQFLSALRRHYLILASVQTPEIAWQDGGGGTFVLPALNPICVRFSKPWVLVSNRQIDFQQVASLLPAGPLTPTGSYVEINWENGRWKYARLMRRLDYSIAGSTDSSATDEDTESDDEGEDGQEEEDNQAPPLFFSENLTSLLDALAPVQRSTMIRQGSHETVRYELR